MFMYTMVILITPKQKKIAMTIKNNTVSAKPCNDTDHFLFNHKNNSKSFEEKKHFTL